ncbi:MAG: EpsG family protein [Bacteroidota bacterium]
MIAAFVEVNKKGISSSFLYTLLLSLVLLEGLRWYSGTDFLMYYTSYQEVLNPITEFHNKRYDVFYVWTMTLFKSLHIDYTFFLIFLSSVTAFLYGWSLKKFTDFPILALLVLFVSLIGFLGSNRQLIALALVFFGSQFVVSKKYWLYILTVFVAMGFHFTAIIMLPLVFFNREINLKKWGGFLLLVFLIGLLPLRDFFLFFLNDNDAIFPFLSERFNSYLKAHNSIASPLQLVLGVLRKLTPVLIVLYFKNQLKERTGYHLFLNIGFLSIALYFFLGVTFPFLLGRLTIYYSVFECILYSWIGYLFVKQKQNQMALLLFFAFCVFLFIKGISLYPELFIPYKTRFFTF